LVDITYRWTRTSNQIIQNRAREKTGKRQIRLQQVTFHSFFFFLCFFFFLFFFARPFFSKATCYFPSAARPETLATHSAWCKTPA
jgi:hypothetical protein